MADRHNLILAATSGAILFANGRGGYSTFGKVTLDEALASFDRYAEWVKAGHGGREDDASPEMRDLLIRAYRLAEQVAAGAISPECGDDLVPILGGAA